MLFLATTEPFLYLYALCVSLRRQAYFAFQFLLELSSILAARIHVEST